MRRCRYIGILMMMALLLLGGMASEAWAAKVTYHILTLPIDTVNRYNYCMKPAVQGHRLEAFKVVIDNQSTVELPEHYKSPLATGFTYYKPEDISGHGGSAINLYNNGPNKGVLYDVKASPTPVAEGTAITTNTDEYYVTYTYNESNTIAKLDGSVNYNIGVRGKGFLSLNRGRNNRPAVIPTAKVDPEMLSTGDFSYVDKPGNNIGTYWQDDANKNKKEEVESQFFFMFKFEGNDPYHIVVRTSYAKNTTYIEKNDNVKPDQFVYKWYKGGSLFAQGTANNYIASDEHIRYNYIYNSSIDNPTELEEGDGTGYIQRRGNWHGQSATIWGTVALLNNTSNTGYVFMGSRTVDGNGAVPGPKDNTKYYYLTFNGYNNLNYAQLSAADATNSHTVDGIYPIRKITFKIVTPFHAVDPSGDHIISVADSASYYTIQNDPIDTKYLPKSLRRKYCTYTNFYKDTACTQRITKFTEANYDETEGYQVFIGYSVSASIPFKAITPASSYDATTWAKATWYEMTDEGSTQEYGRKLKYDNTAKKFKNNGTNGTYNKTTEFAFIGDPYELRVVYRDSAQAASNTSYVPYYVGATGTPDSPTDLNTSKTATAGYKWEIPADAIDAIDTTFLLRKYKGTGWWTWNAGQKSQEIAYATKAHDCSVGKEAQTITFTVTGLTNNKYIKVTTGGEDEAQIVAVTPTAGSVPQIGTSAIVTVKLAENTGVAANTMTVTIQQYNDDEGTQAAEYPSEPNPAVITITQNHTSSFAGNTVQYSTESSTRIKLMGLPTRNFTYNIVDKSGRIAVKAAKTQTIFSSVSLPDTIISPYLQGETIRFYSDNYVDSAGRGTLLTQIYEVPNVSDDIYVTYTTNHMGSKPYKLSEDETYNVKLNGRFIYCTKENDVLVLKTNDDPTSEELSDSCYLWKLRNRDPYAMLIDNMGARKYLDVSGNENVTIYNDAGTGTTESRQEGAWIKLASSVGDAVGLTFTTDRDTAQRFVAKRSRQNGVYEVMVATGKGISSDTTYYHIGSPEANTVKIYKNTSYAHESEQLRFVLNKNIDYYYHLIDKNNHELLKVPSRTAELAMPAEYQSPLVATYHYYDIDNITIKGDTFTVKASPKELPSLDSLEAKFTKETGSFESDWIAGGSLTAVDEDDVDAKAKQLQSTGDFYYKTDETSTYYKVSVSKARYYDIYVTYDVNDIVKFNTGQYMLKFLYPLVAGYHLEDGNDNLTKTKIQAVYPYCNGDGSLNIYGNDMQKEQFHGGAATRPRWVWYFESKNSDPYHVRVRSKNAISYGDKSNYTYLTTYAVHYKQDADANTKHIVTAGTLPGISGELPTEYMIVGSAGNYQLLTTDSIDDGTSKKRCRVDSLEQYWKTYNMLKLCVLNLPKGINNFDSAWVVPEGRRAALNDSLESIGVGSGNWHSYDLYANATRWNGYNDKSGKAGYEKKVVEKLEHWFQTFNMGNGTFDIESAEIPPVMVLLDRHGWEIMRRPLPTTTYPDGDELKAIRVYNSPMVDRYYFYSNASKASGCHKYSLRLQNGAERDQIKANGVHYSTSSLDSLPPITATGVVSGGAIQDFYVTYTVKGEYEKSYFDSVKLNKDDSTYTDTVMYVSKYLMLQNGRFYKVETNPEKRFYITKPIHEHTIPTGGNVYDLIVSPGNNTKSDPKTIIVDDSGNFLQNNFWYVKPNPNIDEEMGIDWAKVTGVSDVNKAKYVVMAEYKEKGQIGFDPYNIQIQLLKNTDGNVDGRYLTSHMTATTLSNGIMIGDYSGEGGTTDLTLDSVCKTPVTSEGYDHTSMKITNQTFMAVSDAKGNMQLMPRFDHMKRVNVPKNQQGSRLWPSTLEAPVDHNMVARADSNASMGPQTTFFINPQRFHYRIIDNNGREALRYKRGADYYPAITDHFKSPVAKNFTYYSGLAVGDTSSCTAGQYYSASPQFQRTLTDASMFVNAIKLLPRAGTYYYRIGVRGQFTYKKVEVTKGLLEQQVTSSFAEANINGVFDTVDCTVYVRYEYDLDADEDGDRLLQGQWYTVQLAGKDLKASGEVMTIARTVADDAAYTTAKDALSDGVYYFRIGTNPNAYAYKKVTVSGESKPDETSSVEAWTKALGLGVNLYQGTSKPVTINADAKEWQWKFFVAPADSVSDYYVEPDPYAIHLFNRHSNYTTDPSANPSPMNVAIKVPNADGGADRFALLSHPNGGYALAVAKEYDNNYRYLFLNGENMTDAVAADTAYEASFNYKHGTISTNSLVQLGDTVEHTFTYIVIANDNGLAISVTQTEEEVEAHHFDPYLPESAQSPLLDLDDYKYYGFARPAGPPGKKAVIEQTILSTLRGLYDDTVYVRYNAYDMDKTSYKVPNKKTKDGSGKVVRDPNSIDVSMDINGGLPYNIVWYSDTTMSSDNTNVTYHKDQALSGNTAFVWYFIGNDPYSLRIQHKSGKYLDGDETLAEDSASAQPFMLLRKDGYEYGILQAKGTTGGKVDKKLTNYGNALTADAATAPTKFIVFGLSLHDLIYRLIIANSCPDTLHPQAGQYVEIPYRTAVSGALSTKNVYGTTQRDLTSKKDGGYPDLWPGSLYQIGDTVKWGGEYHTYSYHAGSVSIGDELVLPNAFYRPNCKFDFYIEGIYTYSTTPAGNDTAFTEMNDKYQGLKLTRLMSDEKLIDQTVVVNVVYSFNTGLETNAGDGFVTEMKPAGEHYLWYTFETTDATPQLAHYTFMNGMRAEKGRALHYTNDYLWSPLGDPYGFKSYNRYIYKNNGETKYVLTTATLENNAQVVMDSTTKNANRDIYELLPGSTPESGTFRVHPLLNADTTLFLSIDESEGANNGKLILSNAKPIKEWTYGLSQELLNPYYQGAGNVGGLNAEAKGKYEEALATYDEDPFKTIRRLQRICYNKDSVVKYTPGYYRLFSQPGASGLSPVRYASGYLHDIEKTAGEESTPIPMHFYSKAGVNTTFEGEGGLGSGFTVSPATRGEIPILATEYDPSTIFQFTGEATAAKVQTQGLYVRGVQERVDSGYVKMVTTSGDATTFNVADIGGGVVIIYHQDASRHYVNYGQNDAAHIYDLQYYQNVDVDGSKWCMQPADIMGLKVTTNNGGDGYYYATFYAPFDVLLPDDAEDNTYNAYTCSKWYDDGVHPTPVPVHDTIPEGKFVPAGTPVILRVKDESGSLSLSLPTSSPSDPVSCVFKGVYLEQLLGVDAEHDVYTLGVPFTSTVKKDDDYSTTGDIVAPGYEFATSGVGFYINATPNKESELLKSMWQRNNRYVQHNKIYYRATGSPASAPERKGVEYVPVLFGDEEEQPDENQPQQRVGDGCVYDILGRKVASAAAVEDGTWYQGLAPGVYIVDGQKIYLGF